MAAVTTTTAPLHCRHTPQHHIYNPAPAPAMPPFAAPLASDFLTTHSRATIRTACSSGGAHRMVAMERVSGGNAGGKTTGASASASSNAPALKPPSSSSTMAVASEREAFLDRMRVVTGGADGHVKFWEGGGRRACVHTSASSWSHSTKVGTVWYDMVWYGTVQYGTVTQRWF